MLVRSHLQHLPVGIRAVWWDYDFTHLLKKKRLGGGYTIIHYLAAVTDNHFAQGVRLHDIPQLHDR